MTVLILLIQNGTLPAAGILLLRLFRYPLHNKNDTSTVDMALSVAKNPID